MKKGKICRGCFADWQESTERCPFCGTPREGERYRWDDWAFGMVLDRRYLLGKIYKREAGYVIWRVYDGILDIPCFLLRERGVSDSLLKETVEMDLQQAKKEGYEILTYKMIGRHPTIVFSMADRYLPKDECQIFRFSAHEHRDKITEVQTSKKRKKVLTTDTILTGRYRVLGVIGIGGFGITYLCEDINIGRNVAVKEYFPVQWAEREEEFVTVSSSKLFEPFRYGRKAFTGEIKTLAKFIHEKSIVTVYDGFSANDTVYMVMEYLSGKSLGKIMKEREGPMSVSEWRDMMRSVLQGLAQLHEKGYLHGDISPGNIFCTDSGDILLIDLGAAKKWEDMTVTFSAAFLKPDYASPEQYQTARTGKCGTEGPWTDLYSLGGVMYYCLTGRKPPDVLKRLEEGGEEIFFSRKEKLKIPKKWRQCIVRCMELDRKKRPQSIEELEEL